MTNGFTIHETKAAPEASDATKLTSNYTNETPNDSFMKGAEWTAPGRLKPAA